MLFLYAENMRLYLNDLAFIETNEPLDISLSLQANEKNVRAWYVDPPRFEPVRTKEFTGSVTEGGSTNFRDIYFNPHGHGTHTECCGHITPEVFSVNERLKTYFFKATLISIQPEKLENGDQVIFAHQFPSDLDKTFGEALIIRTLPNENDKHSKNYSATNPPYLDISCMEIIQILGVQHLLIDLPSVDRESDEGKLVFHHSFFNVPAQPNFKTITEMIFVNDEISDGNYILELQFAPFENDASPSRPVLYRIQKKG